MLFDDASASAQCLLQTRTHKRCIYTDGSCLRPRSKTLAHPGWGVSSGGTADAETDYGPLNAAVQTNYRAELRAMAQALARCKCMVVIYSDCNTIVKQINRYRADGIRITTGTAPQL